MLLEKEKPKLGDAGVVGKMNRSQRRKLKRDQGKELAQHNTEVKWLDTLQPWQKKIIEKMLREAKIDAEIECIETVDKILTGVLFERTDMSWEESFEFNSAFGKYYAEYKFVVSRYGKEKRLKMLQGLEKEIVGKIEKWITEGKSKVEIIKQIREDYKGVGLVSPEVNNVYQRTYENYKNYIKELESEINEVIINKLEENKKSDIIINFLKIEYPRISEKDLRGIFVMAKEEFMKPKYEDYTNVNYVGTESDRRAAEKKKKKYAEKKEAEKKAKEAKGKDAENKSQIPVVEEKVEEIKVEGREKEMSNLKVVKEVVKVVSRELEGEFGKYIADENGVKREDKTFKDLAAVEIYKKEQLAKFEREIAELEAVFEYMSE